MYKFRRVAQCIILFIPSNTETTLLQLFSPSVFFSPHCNTKCKKDTYYIREARDNTATHSQKHTHRQQSYNTRRNPGAHRNKPGTTKKKHRPQVQIATVKNGREGKYFACKCGASKRWAQKHDGVQAMDECMPGGSGSWGARWVHRSAVRWYFLSIDLISSWVSVGFLQRVLRRRRTEVMQLPEPCTVSCQRWKCENGRQSDLVCVQELIPCRVPFCSWCG